MFTVTLITLLFFFTGEIGTPTSLVPVAIAPQLKILWQREFTDATFDTSPVICGDAVFIGDSCGALYALDKNSGKTLWEKKLADGIATAVAISPAKISSEKNSRESQNLFVVDDENFLHALALENGESRWSVKLSGAVYSSPNCDAESVWVATQSGEVAAYKIKTLPNETAQNLWTWKSDDQLRSFPALSAEKIFVAGCDGALHILNYRDGKEIATIPLDSPTGSGCAVSKNMAFVGTEGNEFLGIDLAQNAISWRHKSTQPFRAPAAIFADTVIFGGYDKTLYAADTVTGKIRWQYKTRGRIDGGAVIIPSREKFSNVEVASQASREKNVVLFGGTDSMFTLLDFATGEKLAAIELDGKIVSSPAVSKIDSAHADSALLIIVSTQSGMIYGFTY